MTSPKDAARKLLAQRVVIDLMAQLHGDAKSSLVELLDVGDRFSAAYKGDVFGVTWMNKGRTSAAVSDMDKLARWVAEKYPTEVVSKPVIREAFLAAILDKSKDAGEPCMPDGTLDVPGVRVSTGDAYLSMKPAAEAAAVVARMVADGVFPINEMVRQQLEGGTDDGVR